MAEYTILYIGNAWRAEEDARSVVRQALWKVMPMVHERIAESAYYSMYLYISTALQPSQTCSPICTMPSGR